MSIILKGIDMPKRGEHILALIKSDGKCSYFEETTLSRIMKTTEAIQIPKGHGRLIDADLLKDTVRDSVPAYGIGVKIPTYGDMDIMDKIGFMPTILEAEGARMKGSDL